MDNYFEIKKSYSNVGPSTTYVAKTIHDAFTKGHFPKEPILPAYALAILASDCLADFQKGPSSEKARPLEKFKIFSSKFIYPAVPGKQSSVVISPRPNSKIEVQISQEKNICATLVYQPLN